MACLVSCFQNEEPGTSRQTNAQITALEKTIVEQHFKITELTKQNGTLDLSVRAFTDRLHSFNRVLDERDEELGLCCWKIKGLEGALQAKTQELQNLQTVVHAFEETQQARAQELQEMHTNITSHKARIRLLQDELFFEKSTSRALGEQLAKAEKKLHGVPELETTPEIRRHRLMQELQQIAKVYGEDSEEYRIKQKRLYRLLRAESANPVIKDTQK